MIAGCSAEALPPEGGRPNLAGLTDDDWVVATTRTGRTVLLEVARSPAKRARGLMFRREIPDDYGMLFVLDRSDRHPFWMYNCLVPLDIVWLDARGEIVDISPHTPPCREQPCPNFTPSAPASLVIELAAGQAARLGLAPGGRVLLVPRRRPAGAAR